MNMITSSLAWRRTHEELEPAQGFASRLGALNGRPMATFLREMHIQPRDIDLGEEAAIRRLAEIGRVDFDKLYRVTPHRPADTEFMCIGGETLSRLSVNRTYFNYCPLCIREDIQKFDGPLTSRPWLRLAWVIDNIRSCDKHNVWLIKADPMRKRFEPFDFNTKIGKIIPAIDKACNASKTAPASKFQKWLLQRLTKGPLGNWLDQFPLWVAIDIAEATGLSALHRSKVRTSELTPQDWAEAAEVGFDIASHGENGLIDMFQTLVAEQDNARGYWGLHDTFGYLWKRLMIQCHNPEFDLVTGLLRDFAFKTVPIRPGDNVLGHIMKERNFETVRSVSLASGVNPKTVRRYFQRNEWTTDRKGGVTDHRAKVSAELVRETSKKLKDAISTPEAIRRTNFDREHFFKCVAARHIETVLDTNDVPDMKHRFTLEAVDDFMARLFAGAVEVETPGPNQKTISDARRLATAKVEDILDWVFSDQLRWKGRLAGRADYKALLVDAEEIKAKVREGGTMTNVLRVDLPNHIPRLAMTSVRPLIDSGHLKEVEEFSPDARRLVPVVTLESIDAFNRAYITLGEICHRSGKHHAIIRNELARLKIKPAFDRSTFGSFIYKKDEVIQALGI